MRLFGLILGCRENIFIDEALSRESAIKAEKRVLRHNVGTGRFQQRVSHVRQNPLEAGVCDRIAFEQTAEQFILRQCGCIRAAKQLVQR